MRLILVGLINPFNPKLTFSEEGVSGQVLLLRTHRFQALTPVPDILQTSEHTGNHKGEPVP